ncbi:MFS general substrate transporter [Suhomyces tanzawaensis NRRL Y-17324]|uniref:Autophagy-related protein n=1 Tax=Suhomyces tanzawaensis NRRL Y-17324 TaxID=984487 RepID=A0A1E4SKP5_9ASCO|nr:MFS general substrate transporter [Suhomyces tanzawaensis NRRL Y-17324]ODV80074.1 MFS general substrate transporter [Suhomyces tanzawaensis NRRL Y-17324]
MSSSPKQREGSITSMENSKDVATTSQETVKRSNDLDAENQENPENSIWTQKSIYRAWLLLCFTTGPVASMSRTYVPASIQSIARAVGKTKAGRKCGFKGNDCYVRFGTGTVHFTSYVLYLNAISTALEGVVAILLMGIADYSNYRKLFLIGSIFMFGVFALPFAGLTGKDYPTMKALSALYALISIDNSIYQILEGSYIPLFMRASSPKGTVAEEVRRDMVLKRGSVVSVMGIFLGNVGGIVALLIGIIISYGRGGPIKDGYHNFLLAITIAGAVTVAFSIISAFFIPSVRGKPKPKGEFLLTLSIKRLIRLTKDIQKYPHAFLYCVSWVIWNVSYSNFLSVFVLLFRSTLGLGSSDAEYTVYTFMSYVVASIGSLCWMWLYPRTKIGIKSWGYGFLAFSLFSNFWGCLGISSHTKVGFKHRWEFWIFEVFYSASSSALRSLNRTVYSTLLPEGEEAQYFGLEIMLGVATGWIGKLVNATIQDRTNNDRYPFLPNLFLALASIILYYFVDFEKGMKDAEKLIQEEDTANISYQSTEENGEPLKN